MCQAYTTFFRTTMQNLFLSLSQKTFIKTSLSHFSHYCVSKTSSFYPVENCNFYLVLIGSSLDHFLQGLDEYHFNYQSIDCTYTSYKYRFYSNVISSRSEVFSQLNRAVEHNLNVRKPEKLPSVAKKRVLRKKKIKRHYLSSAQKLASIQTLGSA